MCESTPTQLRFAPWPASRCALISTAEALYRDFLANHLRLFYACAAYSLIHSLREHTLCHTELEKPQPMTLILKLFKLAVRVVQYKDRIELQLPSGCPTKGVLRRVTELLYLARPPPPA